MTPRNFGDRLAAHRQRLGLTYAAMAALLARRLGRSHDIRPALYTIERWSTPNPARRMVPVKAKQRAILEALAHER